MADEISVLVVDDSALMRNLISKMIETTKGLKVAGVAIHGRDALEKIPKLNPDVIVLDLEMPEMTGIEFLKKRRKMGIQVPVVILSSKAEEGAAVTIEALSLGASDFIQKPSGSISVDIATVASKVTEQITAYGGKYRRFHKKAGAGAPAAPASIPPASDQAKPSISLSNGIAQALGMQEAPKQKIKPVRSSGKIEIIAIGISTGGPEALRVVFSRLDPHLNIPILVVQHMPAGFTLEFARSLDKICPIPVKEAEDGEIIKGPQIYIAQGAKHLEVERTGGKVVIRLSDTPLVSGHRPSADVLFGSVATTYTNHVLGVIMTGMGKDGATQLGTVYREGGLTIGQDEATAVVYGMPRVAFELGNVMEQVALENMGKRISTIAMNSKL
ncbi:MAG: chemotaxis response regulator protein-glutamate methylesterase [Termitinemataceae bacterium]|nr:MAG: chemotaxis response regulator protein-glutamate methylesterase [Termitinemataceae bacterium]